VFFPSFVFAFLSFFIDFFCFPLSLAKFCSKVFHRLTKVRLARLKPSDFSRLPKHLKLTYAGLSLIYGPTISTGLTPCGPTAKPRSKPTIIAPLIEEYAQTHTQPTG
jgi:hypothetical protein